MKKDQRKNKRTMVLKALAVLVAAGVLGLGLLFGVNAAVKHAAAPYILSQEEALAAMDDDPSAANEAKNGAAPQGSFSDEPTVPQGDAAGKAADSAGSAAVCGDAEVSAGSAAVCGEAEVSAGSAAVCGEAEVSAGSAAVCGDAEVSAGSAAVCGEAEVSAGSAAVFGEAEVSAGSAAVCGEAEVSAGEAAVCSDADCILVLGCQVKESGRPSDMLRDRLNCGIALYEAGAAPKLLMSGDHGQTGYNEVVPMKMYALEQGVLSEDVFMDHAGFSTYDSIYRAKEVFGARRVIIVSQEYHLYRALYIAQKLGLPAAGVAAPGDTYAGQSVRETREVLARAKDFAKCVAKPLPRYLGEPIDLSGSGDVTNDY